MQHECILVDYVRQSRERKQQGPEADDNKRQMKLKYIGNTTLKPAVILIILVILTNRLVSPLK